MPSLLIHVRRHAQLLLAAVLSTAILIWLWLADTAAAAGATATTPDKGESTPLNLPTDSSGGSAQDGTGSSLARTFVGLFVVIAVIYGVTWVLKQMKASKEGDAFGAGLESSASLPLGGNGRALHLVRAGNEWLLLGVTDGGIAPLRTYSEAEARAAGLPINLEDADELRPVPEPVQGQGAGAFVAHLRNLTVRR